MKYWLIALLFYIFRIFPIKKNKIVVSNFGGRGFGCNGKYIVNVLLNSSQVYDVVWLIDNSDESFPIGVRTVKYKSLQGIYEQCTAKVWIDNIRKPSYVRKRKNQYYIQTYHGDMGIKKFEADLVGPGREAYLKMAEHDSELADLFVTGTEWFYNKIPTTLMYSGEIAKCGYPRRDILYKQSAEKINEIKCGLGIDKSTYLLLYAPTFRKNLLKTDLEIYNIEWKRILSACERRFGGTWKGLIRLHPNTAALMEKINLPEDVVDVTFYPDMQELLLVADCCITDYSSCIFDFAVTGKPGIIFALDYEEYKKERDVNIKLEETPFSIATSNDELEESIVNFSSEVYKNKCDCFYKEKIGLLNEGHASEYIADRIHRICFE